MVQLERRAFPLFRRAWRSPHAAEGTSIQNSRCQHRPEHVRRPKRNTHLDPATVTSRHQVDLLPGHRPVLRLRAADRQGRAAFRHLVGRSTAYSAPQTRPTGTISLPKAFPASTGSSWPVALISSATACNRTQPKSQISLSILDLAVDLRSILLGSSSHQDSPLHTQV